MKPHQNVPGHVSERLEIAILTGGRLQLNWADESSDHAWFAHVLPRAVIERDGRLYLEADGEHGEPLLMRLDLIRNLPKPVK
jgi:Rho-binding antiterminator